jgi:hypothetical protein
VGAAYTGAGMAGSAVGVNSPWASHSSQPWSSVAESQLACSQPTRCIQSASPTSGPHSAVCTRQKCAGAERV